MKKSLNSYNYGIAAYPLNFKEIVISPLKLCLQFKNVQCKVRPLGNPQDKLKNGPQGSKELAINTRGTDINTLAVGIPLRLYPEVLENIWAAIKEHDLRFPENSIKNEILDIFNT